MDTRDAVDTITVLVVDDHEVLATSLGMALDAEPDLVSLEPARDLTQARARIAAERPDVVLLDRRLPDGDGIEAIPDLRALRPSMGVVVLTASDSDQVLVRAIEKGASGFVSKNRGLSEVSAAVRAAAAGEAVISPELLTRLLPKLTHAKGEHPELTQREFEVLQLLSRGLSNAAIAEELFLSVHTVRNHIANLSAKLGAHSKLEVLSIAVRQGLLPAE